MTSKLWQERILLSLFAALFVAVSGCGQADTKEKKAAKKDHDPSPVAQADPAGKQDHDHSGWWCDEHGVPEAECSMCSAKAAAKFKKEGDWCDKHDRARSQCFLCEPEREARYAARYEARYGKKPPVPEENRAKKADNK